MIEKRDIIKMAKHVFRRSQGIPDRALMHPKRDWIIGLSIFSVILIAGGAVSAVQYRLYDEVEINTADQRVATVVTYHVDSIEEALKKWTDQAAAYQAARSQTVRPLPVAEEPDGNDTAPETNQAPVDEDTEKVDFEEGEVSRGESDGLDIEPDVEAAASDDETDDNSTASDDEVGSDDVGKTEEVF